MKKNNSKLLLAFLLVLNIALPMSTDLYLPALPQITAYYDVPEADTNLTLILFFIPFSIAMLAFGPLSDKYGRRPILLVGSVCYCAGSALCVVAPTMSFLIASRVLQAVGGGSAMVAGTAIIKDAYKGQKQQDMLAIVQSISMICPIVAPVIGAFIMNAFSWRGLFGILLAFGVVALAGSVAYRETLERPTEEGVLRAFGRLGVILRNARFNMLLVVFAVTSLGFMAYISSAPYVYQEYFGTSELIFSYYYAAVAVGMVIGPLIYVWLSRRVKNLFLVIAVSFVIAAISCALLIAFGHTGPAVYAVFFWPVAFVADFVRPPGTYLMLNMRRDDTGAASSLIGAVNFLTGAAGMALVMLFNDYIVAVGLLFLICYAAAAALWIGFFRDANRQLSGGERS
jgi:DHA1 family bicyclomycin/chloramphenicol resistance-like MFS transporter